MENSKVRHLPDDHATRWQGPELRWGAGERADMTRARERLLDAARFCYRRLGVANTSMADIAAQAKVTRPTVYRYFKTHREMLDAVLLRELNAFWLRLDGEIGHFDCFGDHLVEALLYLVRSATEGDGADFLFAPTTLPHLQGLLLDPQGAAGWANHPVYAYAVRPGARSPAELPAAMEWFNRLALSCLLRPRRGADNEPLRAFLDGLCPWTSPGSAAAGG